MAKDKKTQSPESNAEEFMRLWQQKWTDMLKEKGWPEGMTMPGMGQTMGHMPFMMPFMGGFGAPDQSLLQRIEALEKRLSALEKKPVKPAAKSAANPQSKPKPKTKPKPKPKSRSKG